MRISTKKILITILSLTLLFYIGCDNENKTGGRVSPTSPEADIDNQIKAFRDSVPKRPTNQTANDLVDSETRSFKGELDAKEQFVGGESEDNGKMPFTLEIKYNKATLKKSEYENPTGILREQIYIDGNKYFCRVEEVDDDSESIYYIEFDKHIADGKITNFKYIEINVPTDKLYSYKTTFTGTLTNKYFGYN